MGRADTPLLGRGSELSFIQGLADRARLGTTQFVIIEGEPGIGKSRLLDEVLAGLGPAGFIIYRAAGEELAGRPFRLFTDSLGIDDGGGDGNDRRYQVIEGIVDVLERQAMREPTVLALDDLHWADPSSIQALHVLSRQVAYLPLVVLMACRPLPRPPELARMVDAMTEAGGCRLRLDPLGEEAVRGLAAARLEAPPGPLLRARLDGAGGNPLFVLELLDALFQEGMIELQGTVAEATSRVDPPPSLRMTVLRRLSVLRRESLELLRTASLFGGSFSAARLALVTGTPLLDVLSQLEEPIALGFVCAAGQTFAFRHDVVREALYLEVPAPVRKGLHLHVGRTLAGAGASAVEVANHLALGAEYGDREALSWLRQAARELKSGAPGMAVQLLERASSLVSPDDADWAPVVRQQIRTLALVGRVREATGLADDALGQVRDPAVALSLAVAKIGPLILQSRFEELAVLLDQLLGIESLPIELRAELQANLAVALASVGDVRALDVLDQLRPYVAEHPRSQPAALCLAVQGRTQWALGFVDRAVELMEGAVVAAGDAPGLVAQMLLRLSAGQLNADRLEEAQATLTRTLAHLERSGNIGHMAQYHWCVAQVHFVAGRWDDALAETASSRLLIEETGAGGASSVFADDPSPLIHLHRGDVGSARAALETVARDPAFRTPAGGVVTRVEPMRAVIEEGGGRPEAALGTWEAWHEGVVAVAAVPDYRGFARTVARLALAQGKQGWLTRVTATAEAQARRAESVPSIRGTALLLNGMLKADPDTLLEAVEAFRAGPRLFDRAEACAEAAVCLLSQGDDRQGRALASEAFDLYAEMGAQRPQAALAAELRTFGVRRGTRGRRQRPVSGWSALTVTEERIVRLVAEGLTNGEIGDRLYISRGTVATHLRSAFRKLSVSSRAELAAEAARHPA